ncbi:MAG: GTPase HflX [Gammaproteobacteria bacterium]|nr:MAG: GTPase HflX [Gammaproteobacteria bacterium]
MTTTKETTEVLNPDAPPAECAILVHIRFYEGPWQEDLTELHLLAGSAGADIAETILGRRSRPDAATFIGKGKAEEVRQAVQAASADIVIVNHDLSPIQERNLQKIVGCRVLDRTSLILDIFAQRARSHEGKLQVELAQLKHLATRLVRGWTHLERQKGGIGLRGPGETQLETDRRLLRERIKKLNRQLQKVQTQRALRRKARHKVPIPTISLVGYTNAGKSSLFNKLTGADVYIADQLFATLDPTMRRVELTGNLNLILADTVGFIRHLPHRLVEAFKSTLEEVAEADILIHVIDSSNPEAQDQIERVNEVLEEIGAQNIPQIMVFNKIDLTGAKPGVEIGNPHVPTRVWCSAHADQGLDALQQAIVEHYQRLRLGKQLRLPPSAGRLRAMIYQKLNVQAETSLETGGWLLDVEASSDDFDWLQKQPDFDPDYIIVPEEPVMLAPTGS